MPTTGRLHFALATRLSGPGFGIAPLRSDESTIRDGSQIYCGIPNESSFEMNDTDDPRAEFAALQAVITALQPVDAAARQRIFDAAATFLELERPQSARHRPPSESAAAPGTASSQGSPSLYPGFSEDTSMSPKEFLFQKQPRTDVERIATLAYYLTHYGDTPQFKTIDLTKLNTEAAQPKFSNAANSANNAVKQGYLVPTTKGQRQLSAAGERFIQAMPDRDAARAAMSAGAPRRRTRRAGGSKSKAATA